MATKKTTGSKQPLDPNVAKELLHLLSTDNAFRREFKRNPSAALVKLGHSAPATPALACGPIMAIAPKKEIAASGTELAAHLTSVAALTNPHCFEAGKVATRLRAKSR